MAFSRMEGLDSIVAGARCESRHRRPCGIWRLPDPGSLSPDRLPRWRDQCAHLIERWPVEPARFPQSFWITERLCSLQRTRHVTGKSDRLLSSELRLLDSFSRSDLLRYGGGGVYIRSDFTLVAAARGQACFSAGGFSEAASTINASNRRALGCRVPGYIEIDDFANVWPKLRLR
jgi:hypothetical protein